MPTIEFDNRHGGLSYKIGVIKSYLVKEVERGEAEILVEDKGIIVALHKGRKLPTVVYPVEDSEGYWVWERVFGEQEVLEEIEVKLEESGVIYERTLQARYATSAMPRDELVTDPGDQV